MIELDWDLINRCLGGDCTPAEWERFDRWVAESPAHREIVDGLRRIATEDDTAADRARDAAVLASLMREIGATASPSEPAGTIVRRANAAPRPAPVFTLPVKPRWSWAIKIAATVVLAVGAGVVGSRLLERVGHPPSATMGVMRTVATARGQRASFQLPDGTHVVLGVASTLRYPSGMASGPREVELNGEAYFGVVHDQGRPFVVRAGDVVARDLGTEFVVRAYPEDAHARVIVRQGMVGLHPVRGAAAPAPTVIRPGQLGRLAADGAPVVEPADTSVYFAWTSGTLVFDGTPLRDALPELGRWFDLEFRLADTALGSVTLDATLANQPTDDALNLLATALGLHQVRHGRIVTLYPGSRGR